MKANPDVSISMDSPKRDANPKAMVKGRRVTRRVAIFRRFLRHRRSSGNLCAFRYAGYGRIIRTWSDQTLARSVRFSNCRFAYGLLSESRQPRLFAQWAM